ncbi:hypothetical protein [Dendronalium phyllosphericum]|nr:hypothetical protein [Dendronalium phyllosphericum]
MSQQLFQDSATNGKPYYTLAQPFQSPIYLLSSGQKLNSVKGGIA